MVTVRVQHSTSRSYRRAS